MLVASLIAFAALWWQGRQAPVRYLGGWGRVRVMATPNGQRVRFLAEYQGDGKMTMDGNVIDEWHYALPRWPWVKFSRGPVVRRSEGASGDPLVEGQENYYAFASEAPLEMAHDAWPLSFLGFHAGAWGINQDIRAFAAAAFHDALGPCSYPVEQAAVVEVPYWMVGALAAALVAAQTWRNRAAFREWSRLPGMCPGCGYDLRATRQRCPECGRSVDAAVWSTPRQHWTRALLKPHFHLRNHAIAFAVWAFLLTWAVLQWLTT